MKGLPVLLPLLIALWAGFRGLDFGKHWDEVLHVNTVHYSLRRESLLTGHYRYPSVCFWICIAALVPEIPGHFRIGPTPDKPFQEGLDYLKEFVKSKLFSMRARTLFLLISSLCILWIYLLVLKWRGNWLEALAAAAILGFSWEINYHSRWVAPDTVTMQFGALTLLCCIMGMGLHRGRQWLCAAAGAAALATGTKYTAGLLLLLVATAVFLSPSVEGRFIRRFYFFLLLALIFVVVFLITTPGALLSPTVFIRDIRLEMIHYQEGHLGFTVESGWDHLSRGLVYLGQHLFSSYPAVSMIIIALAMVGAVALFKQSKALAALFWVFPLAYLLFITSQRVMFVRNFLILAPFLAVLAARGASVIASLLKPKLAKGIFTAAIAALLLVNGAWLVYTGETIHGRSKERFLLELSSYVERHPNRRFLLSEGVRKMFFNVNPDEAQRLGYMENVVVDPREAWDLAAFFPREAGTVYHAMANRPGCTVTWFGPMEVNYEYYCTWIESRILLMTEEEARKTGYPKTGN